MICSRRDAIQLLNKWKADSSLIFIVFLAKEGSISCVGRVRELCDEEDGLEITGDASGLLLGFAGATFEYGEPREAPPHVKLSSELKFVCCLQVVVPSRDRCLLYELARLD